MKNKALISKFIAQLCEKQYAYANSTLATILENKLKEKIKATQEKLEPSKSKSQTKGKKTPPGKMKDKKRIKMGAKKNK